VSGEWDAGAGVDKPARILVVGAVPELRRVGAVRELQHFDDASQAAQPSGMSLLRIDPANSESLSEVPVEISLFFWRRLGAFGRKAAQGISWSANRAAGPGHGADEAQYQETLGAFAGGALDILVGTQMLAKGHDFQRVTLVGVVSADSSLSLPDFAQRSARFNC